MKSTLVADIGGTHARFGLYMGDYSEEQGYKIVEQKVYICSEFNSISQVISAYLEQTPQACLTDQACLAIAGPIDGDRVKPTNLNWDFSIAILQQRFNFKRFAIINDFSALAASTPFLTSSDLVVIKEGQVSQQACKAVIGPGTGLGVGALFPQSNKQWLPIPSEGGHIAFSPINEKEAAILALARRQQPHVSTETFLSGNGLRYLYQILATLHGETVQDSYEAKDISFHAINGSDQTCVDALHLFCGMLGNYCGDMGLLFTARGGVYLGGGILPRFKTFLMDSDFVHRFTHKGVMSDFVQSIPVYLITHPQPALVGAAAYIEQ